MIRSALAALACSLAVPSAPAQDLYDIETLRDLKLTFHQAGWWNLLKQNKASQTYIEADLEVDNVVYLDVGVRLRGKSTAGAPNKKKPFKIKMDAFVPGQELYGYDALRLNNGYFDPSWVRECVMGNLLHEYMPLAKRNYVTLTINGKDWGPYVNEQTKDKAWMGENFEEDWGNRYFCVGGFQWAGNNPNNYKGSYELKNDPGNDPYLDLIALCDIVNHAPTGQSLTDALLPVFNLDSMLWFFAGDNAFGNLDSYTGNSNNWYLVHDMRHDRMEALNHDLNLSFGTWDSNGPTLSPTHGFGAGSRPLVNRTMKHKALKEEYFAHLRTLNEEVLRWDVIEPLAQQYRALIDDAVRNDNKAIYTYDEYTRNLTEPISVTFWVAPGVKPYTEDRHAFLETHAKLSQPQVELSQIGHSPLDPDPVDPITFTARVIGSEPASAVELRWRVVGHFVRVPMMDDGLSGDGAAGDGVYGAVIPPQPPGARVDYYIVSTGASTGSKVFDPRKAEWDPFQLTISFGGVGLRVTEYMYSGAGDELIELTNTSNAALDLTGWSLDDASATPGVFDLSPAGIVLPGESSVVTDGDASAFATDWGLAGVVVLGGNTVAKLGRNDAIWVFDQAGTVQDKLVYGDEDLPGSPRAKDASAWACGAALGADDAYQWNLAEVGDAQGSWTAASGDVGSPGSYSAVDCPGLGDDYCASAANSTGQVAALTASGSLGVEDDALTLRVEQLPAFQPGYFLMSQNQANVPGFGGSQGVLCLGGPIVRFDRDVLSSGPGGETTYSPSMGELPQDIVIQPGETWSFQLWYRDQNPGSTSNTSNGLALTFE